MWQKIVLTRDDNQDAHWQELQDAFEQAFTNSLAPQNAAMYSSRDLGSEEITLFFSPAGAALIRSALSGYAVTECERPESDAVTLLVGHDSASDTASLANRG